MDTDEKLIRLFLETSIKNIERTVIIPTVKMVMRKVVNKLESKTKKGLVYNGLINDTPVSVIRCNVGTPNMAILMELLHRSHVKNIIRIDFCGGIYGQENQIDIGNIVLPIKNYCCDGTSAHYLKSYPVLREKIQLSENPLILEGRIPFFPQKIAITEPSTKLIKAISEIGRKMFPKKMKKAIGMTTDALFCETEAFIEILKKENIEIIDMENSILFLLGKLYSINVCSILSVSDLPFTEYDLFRANKVHPELEPGIDNAIKLLVNVLPKISKEM